MTNDPCSGQECSELPLETCRLQRGYVRVSRKKTSGSRCGIMRISWLGSNLQRQAFADVRIRSKQFASGEQELPPALLSGMFFCSLARWIYSHTLEPNALMIQSSKMSKKRKKNKYGYRYRVRDREIEKKIYIYI